MPAQTKPKSFTSYGGNSNRNARHGKSTVDWAWMRKPRYSAEREADQMKRLEKVLPLLRNASGRVVAPWHNGSSVIGEVRTFITGHENRVRGLAGKEIAEPYLLRLELLATQLLCGTETHPVLSSRVQPCKECLSTMG